MLESDAQHALNLSCLQILLKLKIQELTLDLSHTPLFDRVWSCWNFKVSPMRQLIKHEACEELNPSVNDHALALAKLTRGWNIKFEDEIS